MRLLILYIIFIFSALHTQAADKDSYITLKLKHKPLAEILSILEKQSEKVFSYESSLIQNYSSLSFQAENEPLSSCLKRLLTPLFISYTVSGQFIILKQMPPQYTIQGFIRDSLSSESLINASIYNPLSASGTTSNNYGFYSFTLPKGKVILRTSYVGFYTKEIELELHKDTLIDLRLMPLGFLKEIVVEGFNPASEILSSRTGSLSFTSRTIREVPTLFGEPDLCRTLQQTPGVSPGTEGLTGLYVRGGNGDENLFLIDGNPVYHINHVGGLFSTFNPDALKNVEFYKGSFPARYGGRLSSVIDVRTKDGDMKTYHGGISIGLLAATAQLEGPLWKEKTSFNLAFRRTWLDAITAPIVAVYNHKNNDRMKTGYSFYDLNGKINHIFSHRSRMYLNIYAGQDRLRFGETSDRGNSRSLNDLKWRWGNFVGSLNWNYLFTPSLFGNITIFYSRFQSRMWDKDANYRDSWDGFVSSEEEVRGSYIKDLGYRIEFDYTPLPAHRIKFGMDYAYHQYRPEQHWTTYVTRTKEGEGEEEDKEQTVYYTNEWIPAHKWTLYAENDWLLSERWKINPGMRFSAYHVQGRSYLSLQPRFSARYLIRPELSAKVAYAKMNQYVHQLSNSYLNLPSDIWVPVTEKVKPMSSHQVSAGLYYNLCKQYDFSLEGYYKKMNELIDYQDGASLFPAYTHWDRKISSGTGRSYGLEVMARKPSGKVSGWVAYTLAWSDRIFKDGSINSGLRFPARYDNRHKLNIAAMFRLSRKVELSAAWTYMSGNRMTVPVDYYQSLPPDPNNIYQYYSDHSILRRNAVRLGDYHRLDLGINIYRHTKKGHVGIWNISLYNAYSRLNPLTLTGLSIEQDGSCTIYQTGYIPLIPSFSYTYKF